MAKNSLLYTKDGKFKFTIWFMLECPKEYQAVGGDNLSFAELLAVAKTTYYIKKKNGDL